MRGTSLSATVVAAAIVSAKAIATATADAAAMSDLRSTHTIAQRRSHERIAAAAAATLVAAVSFITAKLSAKLKRI